MNRKQKQALIAMGIAGLEEIVRRHKICLDVYNVRFGDAKIAYNSCMTRLAEHDESLEALNESVEGLGHLSRCGLCADLLQRVRCIEQIQDKREANGHDMHDQRIVTLEMQIKEINSRLMALTNEILKQRPKNLLTVKKPDRPRKTSPSVGIRGGKENE